MKTRTAPLTVTPVPGRRIFLTNGPVTIGQDANAKCEASKPAGTGTVKALRSTTTVAASTLIAPAATYVRPDGIAVGKGSDLLANALESGTWQQGDGTYLDGRAIWTGSDTPSTTGTTASTCSDWTSTAGTTTEGNTTSTDLSWWHNTPGWSCANTYTWVRCIEQ